MAKTYENIGRLFNAQGKTAVGSEWTTRLAQQVMAQAGDTTNIDQGGHDTCSVTTVETMIYTDHPAAAAKLVADVALTGKYVAADGTRVNVDRASLRPDPEAATHPPKDGERSFATQLANVTLTNVHYAKHNKNVRYEQHAPSGNSTGERLIDYSKNPPVLVREGKRDITTPNLEDDHIVDIYRRVTGDTRETVYLAHKNEIAGAGKLMTTFETQEQLGAKLQELEKAGKLPVILKVNTNTEPFWTASGGGTEETREGPHVVTVRKFVDGNPPKVQIDNQYGSKNDHGPGRELTLNQLYLGTLSTEDATGIMQQKVEADRAEGKINHYNEMDLLRMQWLSEQIKPAEYNTKVVDMIKKVTDDWKQQRAAGTLEENEEYERTKVKIGDLIETQNSAGKMASFRVLAGTRVLDDDSFAEGVKLVVEYAFDRKDQLTQKGKYDATARTVFTSALKEMPRLFDAMSPELRMKSFAKMDDKLISRIIGNLPAAQQLRYKREIIESGRKLGS